MAGDRTMIGIMKRLGRSVSGTQEVKTLLSQVEGDLRAEGILQNDEEINISFVKKKGSAKKGGAKKGGTKKGGGTK
jgi:hypothetical protein